MDLFISSSANFRDSLDALALYIHCWVLSKGWSCISLSSDLSNEEKSLATVPRGWNSSDDVYCFQYSSQSDKRRVVLKMMRMSPHLICYMSIYESSSAQAPTESASLELDASKHIDSQHLADHNQQTIIDAKELNQLVDSALISKLSSSSSKPPSSASSAQSVLIDDRRGREVFRPHPGRGVDDDDDFLDPLRIGHPRRSVLHNID